MRQVTLPQLFLIDVVIDIYGLAAGIPSQLFNKIPGHSSPKKMSHKPMAAAMGRKPLL